MSVGFLINSTTIDTPMCAPLRVAPPLPRVRNAAAAVAITRGCRRHGLRCTWLMWAGRGVPVCTGRFLLMQEEPLPPGAACGGQQRRRRTPKAMRRLYAAAERRKGATVER